MVGSVTWVERARALAPELIALRRELHRHPEVGLHLPRTQRAVVENLAGLDIEVHKGAGYSSVVAVIRGEQPPAGKSAAILLRADMDALPISEETDLPFASQTPDAMHACGHDLHTAALVGAARLLSESREHLAGDVVLMFQPGEEGYNGAGRMIDDGVLDIAGTPVRSAYALHVVANLPQGLLASRPGPLMAASSDVDITVRGQGGHGSMPHLVRDPLHASAALVSAMYALTPRSVDPLDSACLTLGTIHAGFARGAVPEAAEITGTLRTFDDATLRQFRSALERIAEGIGHTHGVDVDIAISSDYPVVVNDAERTSTILEVGRGLFGLQAVHLLERPAMAAEDFSHVLNRIPGAMVFVGAHDMEGDPIAAPGNHSANARFHEGAIVQSAALLAAVAASELAGAGGEAPLAAVSAG
jgi:hippurate hydrolase